MMGSAVITIIETAFAFFAHVTLTVFVKNGPSFITFGRVFFSWIFRCRLPGQAATPCENALSMAQVDASALSSVLVIGGCCRTPALQDMAVKIFGKAGGGGGGGGDGVVSSPEQSDEMVVLGAALEARTMIYGE